MLLNASQLIRFWNLLIFGPSGVGKTTLGVTAPDPVILLAERQGFESVRDAAARLGKPVPPTFWVRTRDDVAKCVAAFQSEVFPLAVLARWFGGESELKDGESLSAEQETAIAEAVAALPYTQPKTIVCDSVTEMFQQVWDHILTQAPAKIAKDGLPDTNMRHWGAMKERCAAFIRSFRDLPYHVIFLALEDDKETGDDDARQRVVGPATPMRTIPGMLAAACNAVGQAQIRTVRQADEKAPDGVRNDLVRYVRFFAPSYVLTKPHERLAADEQPDVSKWFAQMEGGDDAPAPEPVADAKPKTQSRRRRGARRETLETKAEDLPDQPDPNAVGAQASPHERGAS